MKIMNYIANDDVCLNQQKLSNKLANYNSKKYR